MSIRFQNIIFFRIAILALFAGLSSLSHAGYYMGLTNNSNYVTGQCYSTEVEVCTSAKYPDTLNNGTKYNGLFVSSRCQLVRTDGVTQPGNFVSTCTYTCPAGQGRIANGTCSTCPAGQSVQSDGKCGCPSGTEYYNAQCVAPCPAGSTHDQTLEDIIANIPSACRTPPERCQYRKSKGPQANINLKKSIDGCRTNCSINAEGAWPVTCEFTGEPYTPGTGEGDNVQNAPPLEAPPEKTASNDTCPPNTDPGYVNGVRYCAPRTKSNGEPNVSPSLADTNTSVTTTTSTTTTNADGSTTMTSVTTTFNSGGSSSGVGGGSGNGEGSDLGGGDCDPRDSNYLQCISGSPHTYGNADYAQWFNTSEIDQQIADGKQQLKDKFDEARQGITDGMSLHGQGSLPSFGPFTVWNHSYSLDLSQYQQQLSIIAQGLLLVSLMISAYIIFNR